MRMPGHGMEAGTADPVLEDLFAEPCAISAPAAQAAPLVFASPHSGRRYPLSLVRASRLSSLDLRRSEDAYVDRLFAGVPLLGAPLIRARFPRAYVDPNRAPGEIDPSMFHGRMGLPIEPAGPRVNAGLGVIPRIVREGAEIYRGRLNQADAQQRLVRLHRPYHTALAALVRGAHARFGRVVVVDCHSMPSAAGAPDIVLGDRYGSSASPALLGQMEEALAGQGFSVGRNVPYAGGYTTHIYGKPASGTHALQVEINRALYLDEERIEPAASFSSLRERLMQALAAFTAAAAAALPSQEPARLAAE